MKDNGAKRRNMSLFDNGESSRREQDKDKVWNKKIDSSETRNVDTLKARSAIVL